MTLRGVMTPGTVGVMTPTDTFDGYALAEDCTCVFSCADDPETECSQSGTWHTHPSAFPGDGLGACPEHPDAPGDV